MCDNIVKRDIYEYQMQILTYFYYHNVLCVAAVSDYCSEQEINFITYTVILRDKNNKIIKFDEEKFMDFDIAFGRHLIALEMDGVITPHNYIFSLVPAEEWFLNKL